MLVAWQVICKAKSTINGDVRKCPYARHLYPAGAYPKFMGGPLPDDSTLDKDNKAILGEKTKL